MIYQVYQWRINHNFDVSRQVPRVKFSRKTINVAFTNKENSQTNSHEHLRMLLDNILNIYEYISEALSLSQLLLNNFKFFLRSHLDQGDITYCSFSYAGILELVNLFVRTKNFSYHICYENSSKTQQNTQDSGDRQTMDIQNLTISQ